MRTPEAEAQAEIAMAMSHCMNTLFFFSAPRIIKVPWEGPVGFDRAKVLDELRLFLRIASEIRARADREGGVQGDVARLVQTAMVVEEVAGLVNGAPVWELPLPMAIVERSRRAVALFGMDEPPGGWDAFEGFDVSSPAPASPRSI